MRSRRETVVIALAAMAVAALPACTTAAQSPPQTQVTRPMTWYVFTFRPGPAWRDGVPMNKQALGPHAAYWKQLVAEGRAVAAGGFVHSAGGMAIVRASHLAEAEGIRAADPAIVSGVFVAAIEAWTPGYQTPAFRALSDDVEASPAG